uniref:Uncharacterized protein n=1 Tax=Panagrolaimus superbus TaxID=310955 RepID=A0A914YVU4_9BILA
MDEFETLHQLSYLCGKAKCEDLESEVNLDILWEKINTENKAKKLCQNFGDIKNVFTDSDCPFSTRIDVQYYFYKKHQESQITEELCVDRFGRKYPPPEGLGGKCVVFQHEFEKDGKQITEFFMPIEQRDMVQRILQYPYTHEIRKNATTLNRLLPKTDVQIRLQETNCTTLHYYGGMFFHCIYNPDQSHLFLAKETDYFNCPKNEHLSLTSEIGLPVGMVYSIQKIDSDRYEFSNVSFVMFQ